MKKLFKPVTKSIEDVSENVTRAMMETSRENNKSLANLNHKLLKKLSNKGILASCLLSPLYKMTNPEHTSQHKLVKDPDLSGVNDLLINKIKPVTLHDNLLTFHDTDKVQLSRNPVKLITNNNYNVDLANIPTKKTNVWSCGGKLFW